MAVPVQTDLTFSHGTPQLLFDGYFTTAGGAYDVAPDGRFLMIREQRGDEGWSIVAVLNWSQELLRLVPVD